MTIKGPKDREMNGSKKLKGVAYETQLETKRSSLRGVAQTTMHVTRVARGQAKVKRGRMQGQTEPLLSLIASTVGMHYVPIRHSQSL